MTTEQNPTNMPVATYTSSMVSKEGRQLDRPPVHRFSGAAGKSLLEFFCVRVDQVPAQHSEVAIYGTITMHGGYDGTQVFWARPQESPMPICPGERIPLEGPFKRPIPALGHLDIELDIYTIERGSSGPGISIAQGTVCSDSLRTGFRHGMEVRQFCGDAGSVTVHFMSFSRALSAEITVLLVPNGSGDNESHHSGVRNVYGNISAHNGHGESELFRKSKDQYVSIEPPTTVIPLCRDVVVVPRDRSLVVKAAILQADTAADTVLAQNDDGLLLALGDVEFEPERGTSQQRLIRGGTDTNIVVRVTWD